MNETPEHTADDYRRLMMSHQGRGAGRACAFNKEANNKEDDFSGESSIDFEDINEALAASDEEESTSILPEVFVHGGPLPFINDGKKGQLHGKTYRHRKYLPDLKTPTGKCLQ